MKKLLFGLVLSIAVVGSSAGQGQGTAVRALNGFGTNLTTFGTVTNKNSAGTSIITLTPTVSGLISQLRINGVPVGADVIIQDGEVYADRFIGATIPGFVGDGSGLTNLSQIWTNSNNYTRLFVPGESLTIVNSTQLYGFGNLPFQDSTITDSQRLYAIGDGGLGSSSFANCDNVYGIGSTPIFGSVFTGDCDVIFAIGHDALTAANISNSDWIFAIGALAMDNAAITNSQSIYAIGSVAGQGLSGSFTNLYLIGTGATAPNGTANAVILGPELSVTIPSLTNTVSVAADSAGKLIHGGTTNTWGNDTVPFNLGPNLRTNMAGNLTIAGVVGFQNDVYNQVWIRLLAGASDRTLTIPSAWTANTNSMPVNCFTNATTATIAANTLAWLLVECLPGHETNAFLVGSYP